VAGGDVGRGGRAGLGHGQAVVGVGAGQGGQVRLLERGHPGAGVAGGRRDQQPQGPSGPHDPGQPAQHRRLGGQQTAQQRAPGEVDGHQVGQAVQLRRQGLGRGHHEQRVGQPAPLGSAAGPSRRLSHRGRAGVHPDDQPVRVGDGRRQREPPVAGAKVDGCRPVAGGQVMDLADVHVPGAPALDDPHGPRPPLVLFLVRWQCSGSSRGSQPNFAPGRRWQGR
jgi:hypothetical protein